jgi:hypothetical protein
MIIGDQAFLERCIMVLYNKQTSIEKEVMGALGHPTWPEYCEQGILEIV